MIYIAYQDHDTMRVLPATMHEARYRHSAGERIIESARELSHMSRGEYDDLLAVNAFRDITAETIR